MCNLYIKSIKFFYIKYIKSRLLQTANVRFKVIKFQDEKWADKNSLKQFLTELAWIYRFSCSYNEHWKTRKLDHVVQIHVCRLP